MDEIRRARKLSPLGILPAQYYHAISKTARDPNGKLTVRGLYTRKAIAKETLLGEYRGVIIDEKQMGAKNRATNYMFAVHDLDETQEEKERGTEGVIKNKIETKSNRVKFIIDGAVASKSSWPRYVNAPNKQEDANTEFRQLGDHILLWSIRRIPKHTELLAWYGDNTWDVVHSK